ncbi:hypothetical protein [Kerstersia similis]|uniref:hypothetical protein n=1 Tax=Kerstersia similis TaxID=206505 RepID=UPI0039EFE0AD
MALLRSTRRVARMHTPPRPARLWIASKHPGMPEGGKTDDQLGGLLAAIRNYGSWKYAEAKGRTEPDLSDVRAAWDEVYEKVQTLAALAQQASAGICNSDKRQIPESQLRASGLDKDNIDAARAAAKEQ